MRVVIGLAAVCAALGGVPAVALAQAYRCTAPDGAVTLQQTPCAVGAQAQRIALPPAAPERAEHIRRAIAERKVTRGMTRAEVVRSAGREPDSTNRSVGGYGVHEQLVYRLGRDTLYVYLEDGVVTSHSRYNAD